jgi:hypothetical protein
MSSSVVRIGFVAALVLTAVPGCLGDDEGASGPGGGAGSSAIGAFAELEQRPLDLPAVEVPRDASRAEREFRYLAGNCWSWGAPEVGALASRGIPGEAALGPWPGIRELERGPVYAALLGGAPRIVFLSGQPTIEGSKWRVVRTVWSSRPSYEGPVLVRGGRLDRTGRLGFGSRTQPRRTLRLPATSWPQQRRWVDPRREDWRATSVPTRIRKPGCYAFQVDGLGFSYVLTFGVQQRSG